MALDVTRRDAMNTAGGPRVAQRQEGANLARSRASTDAGADAVLRRATVSAISRRGTWGFAEILLAGVILAIATSAGLVLGLYVLPREPVAIPELEPAVRVGEESGFPVGASRVQNWGDRIILVVREGERRYYALEGTSPLDGCILRWDPESLRVVSPCAYVVFDLHGNVVEGLTTVPLRRYSAFVRSGVVYVTEG